ncbi:hypothetical protein E2R51_11455 [Jeotgalibacillus sp. S-D1]|uniref:hypothetical protein n=1 Tax=Jeotgalibacillus sp. S-D1 TaxID=2552189 RepID=UPI0010593223|nr:hypothetical protein [Jeotgalibacillus sp. S-D1]TDL31831.1 hypothetical protein E2R51_11455 [Jeotgalibacillus sp. S-D1]
MKIFEIVKKPRQQKQFEQTWEYFCRQFGWYNDPYSKNGVRYNLLLPANHNKMGKKVIGTIEFIPYDPANPDSTVEGESRYKFSGVQKIIENKDRVWEIDKLCLHKDFHRLGYFSHFITVVHDHAITHNPKFYVAIVENKLYRMLSMMLGSSIVKQGDPIPGPSTSLVPVIINIEDIRHNASLAGKLMSMAVLKESPKKKTITGFKKVKKIFFIERLVPKK